MSSGEKCGVRKEMQAGGYELLRILLMMEEIVMVRILVI